MSELTSSKASRKAELKDKVSELETSLAALKHKLRVIEQEEQRHAIDHLDEYLDRIDHKYDNLKVYWAEVAAELRKVFNH
ncbi:MAG: hypothetical protein HOM55_08250 [Proteobacteria bacterium]|jgi:predicted nuclease with TOPRIM domain|nr:hypothetical protein [Pseudomonadota bacterium]